MSEFISVKGARVHNLKNIEVKIPKQSLTIITGLSGSGKSSLALDTIYAEGQRRYLESLSSYARQFLGEFKKPDVDNITGLSPSIAIEQKSVSHNPRSTVGTVTEIHDYLRILYSKIGVPHCPECGREVQKQTIDEIIQSVFHEYKIGDRLIIKAPIARGKKGEFKRELESLKKKGYVRIEIDGENYDLEENISLDKNKRHFINLIVDRVKLSEENQTRITDSIELSLSEGNGIVEVYDFESERTKLFSENFACTHCNISLPEINPKIFSFNNPYGACPVCHGLGITREFDENLIVDENLSIPEGALKPMSSSENSYSMKYTLSVLEQLGENSKTKFKDLKDETRRVLLHGSDKEIKYEFRSEKVLYQTQKKIEGIINNLKRRYFETHSEDMRRWLEDKFMVESVCPECQGKRLRKEALSVTVNGKNISELSDLTITEIFGEMNNLSLSEQEKLIIGELNKEILKRLKFLIDVGLGYITLSRKAKTLSGGEAQRIRLATQIGSGLTGVTYVLDEPTIGLHPRDNDKLIKTLKNLRDLGNTVIVVEHDEEVMRSSNYIVDIGPGAGIRGGKVIYQGLTKELINNPPENSLTGKYLSGKKKIPIFDRTNMNSEKFIELLGAKQNNLKSLDVKFPLGKMICVTGVSGSGKSSLVIDTLYPVLRNRLNNSRMQEGIYDDILGLENLDNVIVIDQSPIGRTPRSNPATYTGIFDHIRDIFSKLPESRARGYKKGRYSFNVKGGRCEVCKGHGLIKIEMQFLPDVFVECDVCKGKRYNKETLEIKYNGKNISDILEMTVEEAYEFFEKIPQLKRILNLLIKVGLSYIRLGQPATTLSGGEAQRIKLSSELKKRSTGRTFYILDEPTTGLHFDDVEKLIKVLNKLVEKGNTVLVVEHNLDVIKNADYIIDLGPEGGKEGGNLLVCGTLKDIVESKKSYTGNYLRKIEV